MPVTGVIANSHYYGLLFSCSGMSSLFLCFDVVLVSYVVFALCGLAGWWAGWRGGRRAGTGRHAGTILPTSTFPISVVSLYSTFNVLFAGVGMLVLFSQPRHSPISVVTCSLGMKLWPGWAELGTRLLVPAAAGRWQQWKTFHKVDGVQHF